MLKSDLIILEAKIKALEDSADTINQILTTEDHPEEKMIEMLASAYEKRQKIIDRLIDILNALVDEDLYPDLNTN